jgi:hypothetical protein
MDGYAAYGRLDRRRVVGVGPRFPAPEDSVTRAFEVIDAGDPASAGPPAGRTRHERLAAAREQWTIMTFFLFDANSWR